MPYVTILEIIRSQNVPDLDLGLQNLPGSNVNIPKKRSYATSYSSAIVMFALSVTILEKWAGH